MSMPLTWSYALLEIPAQPGFFDVFRKGVRVNEKPVRFEDVRDFIDGQLGMDGF